LKIQAVFFDFDGTLVDSMPAHVAAWSEILGGIGLKLEDRYFELHEGERAEDTIKRLLSERGFDYSDKERADLIERKRALYRTKAPKGLNADARKLVEELRARKIDCDIVTGSIRRNLDAVLADDEISLFRNIITPADYAQGKPAPDPYLKGLEHSGLEREQCLVLENAPLGIQSAKGAKLQTLAITTTLEREHLREADVIIDSFESVLHYV
jgi:beta-phosphoglucomutase